MHIFFDVDGVLIDGFHTKPERQNRWDKTIERDLGIHSEKFQEIFSGWFLQALQGRLDFEEEMASWLKKNDYDLKAWQVINYWHEKDSVINRPVYDIIQRLSANPAIHLYTATNQTHARIAYLRDVLNFGIHFKDFYYSARLGCLKSDPHYFAQIESELGIDPRQNSPLYFDDDPVNIDVASQRGWNAVLVDGSEDVTDHPLIRSLL